MLPPLSFHNPNISSDVSIYSDSLSPIGPPDKISQFSMLIHSPIYMSTSNPKKRSFSSENTSLSIINLSDGGKVKKKQKKEQIAYEQESKENASSLFTSSSSSSTSSSPSSPFLIVKPSAQKISLAFSNLAINNVLSMDKRYNPQELVKLGKFLCSIPADHQCLREIKEMKKKFFNQLHQLFFERSYEHGNVNQLIHNNALLKSLKDSAEILSNQKYYLLAKEDRATPLCLTLYQLRPAIFEYLIVINLADSMYQNKTVFNIESCLKLSGDQAGEAATFQSFLDLKRAYELLQAHNPNKISPLVKNLISVVEILCSLSQDLFEERLPQTLKKRAFEELTQLLKQNPNELIKKIIIELLTDLQKK